MCSIIRKSSEWLDPGGTAPQCDESGVPEAAGAQEIEEVTTMMEDTRIVIVGGGFAGVTLAEQLDRRVAPNVEVVVRRSVISTD